GRGGGAKNREAPGRQPDGKQWDPAVRFLRERASEWGWENRCQPASAFGWPRIPAAPFLFPPPRHGRCSMALAASSPRPYPHLPPMLHHAPISPLALQEL